MPVEPGLNRSSCARDPAPSACSGPVRIGPVGREHRVERERHEQRHQHRARDRQRERLEPLPADARHERDRHEHREDRERRRRHGEADLVGALVRRRDSGPSPSRRAARCSRAPRSRRRSGCRSPARGRAATSCSSVKPNAHTAMNDASTETGSARPVMTVERHEFRNRNTTSTVSSAPSISASSTFRTECVDPHRRRPCTTSSVVPGGQRLLRSLASRARICVAHVGGAVALRLLDVDADRFALPL